MGEPEEVDHAAAGLAPGSASARACPGGGVFATGKDAVAVDRSGEGLRLATQGMDDVAVVDAVGPPAVWRARKRGWLSTWVLPSQASMRSS